MAVGKAGSTGWSRRRGPMREENFMVWPTATQRARHLVARPQDKKYHERCRVWSPTRTACSGDCRKASPHACARDLGRRGQGEKAGADRWPLADHDRDGIDVG